MSVLSGNFEEVTRVGEQYDKSRERYPYYVILDLAGFTDDTLRRCYLEEIREGLAGIDYNAYSGAEGRFHFNFRTEADRDTLFRARGGDDFDYNVRKRMERPGPGFSR